MAILGNSTVQLSDGKEGQWPQNGKEGQWPQGRSTFTIYSRLLKSKPTLNKGEFTTFSIYFQFKARQFQRGKSKVKLDVKKVKWEGTVTGEKEKHTKKGAGQKLSKSQHGCALKRHWSGGARHGCAHDEALEWRSQRREARHGCAHDVALEWRSPRRKAEMPLGEKIAFICDNRFCFVLGFIKAKNLKSLFFANLAWKLPKK